MGIVVDYESMVGKRFHYLTFLKVLPVCGKWRMIELMCDCGNTVVAMWDNVKRGKTKSCGCKRFPTGEMVKHPLRKIWVGMRQRCNNPNSEVYYYYGAKGVRVCEEWDNDFSAFYKWCMANGWKKGLEIDKDIIPKKLGIAALLYSPEYCSIVTRRKNVLAIVRKPKLTKDVAEKILNSPLSGRELAKEMKLTRHVISEVRNNKYWGKYK